LSVNPLIVPRIFDATRFFLVLLLSLSNAGVSDSDGQELNNSVLFGEHIHIHIHIHIHAYDVMIHQYIHDNKIDLPIDKAISAMVEVGLHKMGHVKQIEDLCEFI